MKLPHISGIDVVKRPHRVDFVATRQTGSHVRLEKRNEDGLVKLTVPLHKQLKKGTLHRIIKDAGLTAEEVDGSK
jgi:predicted RNA binding protein YcfA (HicA-like mRNA interferase family)